MDQDNWRALAARIKDWGRELGFAAIRIVSPELRDAETGLFAWLQAGCHGEMDYMARHGAKRARPGELLPGTRAVIIARMNYLPDAANAAENLGDGRRAYISRYALGRDYHKLLRARLQTLAARLVAEIGPRGQRVFVDSAPVMEVELATQAGLGWRGKHTLLLSRDAGSLFFLGEIYTDLPLPPTAPVTDHCGSCRACLDACPTGAIVRSEYGTVVIQDDVCNGCGYCVTACPFGVITLREIGGDGGAHKCTLCYDRLGDGLEPACAKACPTKSIQYGPLGELRERAHVRLAELAREGVEDARLYLASDDARYVTGTQILVDGGMLLPPITEI